MTGSDRWGAGGRAGGNGHAIRRCHRRSADIGRGVDGHRRLAGDGPIAGPSVPFSVRPASSQIDVGDAGTSSLFDLSTVEPGDSIAACFRARIDAGSRGQSPVRLYSSGLTEIEHARSIGIHVSRQDPVAGSSAAAGVIECDEIDGSLTSLTLRNGSVADYVTTRFAYAIGDPLGSIGPGISTVVVRVALVFPDAVAVSAARGLATGWVIETH